MSSNPRNFRPRRDNIEAMQIKLLNFDDVVEWVNSAKHRLGYITIDHKNATIVFDTIHGFVHAGYNWWIIRTREGKVYPMSPKTFKQKYEEIDDKPVL